MFIAMGERAGTAVGGRPLKVTFVLPNIESGGTERHVLSLVRLLDREHYRLSLLTTAGGGSLYDEFRELIPVHVQGDPRQGQKFRSSMVRHLRTVLFLAGKLRAERPDIVHAYLPAANVLAPMAARLAGVRRVIVSKRALANYKNDYPRLSRFEGLGNRLADVVLVNSDAVAGDVERTETGWAGKIRKVYNGVEAMEAWSGEERASFRRREGTAADAVVLIAVSNFYRYKAHGDLVHAFNIIAGENPDARLLLVGRDAGTMADVRSMVAAAKLEDAVRFLGDRSDVPDLLRAADIFVHPSYEEGFSNAILEAMAAGLPVVACRAGGNGEAVVDGETGLLVPAGKPHLFAGAVAELLKSPPQRGEMGEAGRRRAGEHFSLTAMVKGVEELYGALSERGR